MTSMLGIRLRQLRSRRGYTITELAVLSDCSKSYIWELEKGDSPRPSGQKLLLIATALGVTTDYLLGHKDEELGTEEDKFFFRKYMKLNRRTRLKVREMLNIISRGE